MIARWIGVVALAAALAVPASAQRTIRVIGSDGRPIPAVRVEVLGRGELIGVHATSGQGIAVLSAERWAEVRRISLSHLGFQTLIVQADDIPSDGVLRLEPQPIELEAIAVEATELCPIPDDGRARRLWADVASLYATDTGSRAWLAYFSRYDGSVRQDALHRPPATESNWVAAGGPDGMPGSGDPPRPLGQRIATEGYAWSPLAIGGSREIAWKYPELDRELAHHFASRVFGDLHDFSVHRESAEQTTLVFCGNGQVNGATINGTITLVPGLALLGAEWRFKTAEPDEGAGGSVWFDSFTEGPTSKPHLVAARGLFYRHGGTEVPYPGLPRSYVRFGISRARWHVLPTGDRPCNDGLSFHGDPPPQTDGRGVRFAACVAEHWGR